MRADASSIAPAVFEPPTPPSALDQVYQAIKGLEDIFPIPIPVATVTMGTFNASTGAFSGIKSTLQTIDPFEDIEDDPGRPRPKPQPVLVPPEIEANGVNVELRFSITRPHGAWSVTANGIQVFASASQDTITVNVGRAFIVPWSVQSGTEKYSDKVIIQRPPILGVGAFTIPALPVAVIYEPPSRPFADRQPNNKASYGVASSISTATTVSLSLENSTSTTESKFEALETFVSILESLTGVAQAIDELRKKQSSQAAEGSIGARAVSPLTVAQAVIAIGSALSSFIGEESTTFTSGTTVTSENTLAITDAVVTNVSTGANDGGPGVGDLIYFLKNARLAWLASEGPIRLALLGYDGVAFRTAGFLKDNLDTGEAGVSRETAEALLALDPFVAGGPDMSLPAARFEPVTTIELNGVDFIQTVSQTITQADLQATTSTVSKVEDFRAGALAFLGIGVTEDRKVVSTIRQRNATSVTTSRTVSTSVELHADSDELYAIAVSYDRVFGTFAFQPAPVLEEAVLAGVARTRTGQPLVRQPVTLQAQGQKYMTYTDAQGRWAFHVPTLKPGRLELSLGQTSQLVQFTGLPIRNLELR